MTPCQWVTVFFCHVILTDFSYGKHLLCKSVLLRKSPNFIGDFARLTTPIFGLAFAAKYSEGCFRKPCSRGLQMRLTY